MNANLKQALDAIINIEQSSGMNRKLELLKEQKNNETMKDILYFVYNPYIRVGIGYAKLEKATANDTDMDECSTIQGVFTYLLHNRTGRDVDANKVKTFISLQEPEYKDVLYKVFTKNFSIGISSTSIHKVWPGLLPGFAVQLACKWQDHFDYLEGKEIFITEKLDGNRCLAQVKDHKCTFYSRSGREINGLEQVENELSRLIDGWYDGELLGKDFQETQSTLRTKGSKTEVVFNIFDYITDKEVQEQQGIYNYLARRNELERIFKGIEKFRYVKLVPLIGRGEFNKEWVRELLTEWTSNGSEGLMINLNSPYQFGRTIELLKVKNMYTLDLRIIGMREGSGEFANTCGALIVDYKGYEVGVGSGISKNERIEFWNNREKYIGKVVEVQAFEQTTDQNGNLSLRFPVFIRVREEGKEVSYD